MVGAKIGYRMAVYNMFQYLATDWCEWYRPVDGSFVSLSFFEYWRDKGFLPGLRYDSLVKRVLKYSAEPVYHLATQSLTVFLNSIRPCGLIGVDVFQQFQYAFLVDYYRLHYTATVICSIWWKRSNPTGITLLALHKAVLFLLLLLLLKRSYMIIIWGECFRILKKQTKNFWTSHLNECPELLFGLSCDHRWSQTIPIGNSPWGKRTLQGITISLGPAILWVVWWPGRSCTLRRGQVLVFINRHSPTMNLVKEKQGQGLVFINRHSPTMNIVKEKQRGLIPPGLQRWPLQLIEHLTNTSSVGPPPAGPAGCCSLYLIFTH